MKKIRYEILNKINFFFLSSIVILIAIIIAKYPYITRYPFVWAESGKIYFPTAVKLNILDGLRTTDFGYLPLTQNLIKIILVKFFNCVSNWNMASQWVANISSAIFLSMINLRMYKKIIKSDILRYFIVFFYFCLLYKY